MRTFSFFKAVLLIAAMSFFSGCEKEQLSELKVSSELSLGNGNRVERPFKGRIVSSTRIVGDFDAGYTQGDLLPAWYPGSGVGNVTHMGKINTYFSQYAVPIGSNLAQVAGAPVTMFFNEELSNLFTPGELALMAELEVNLVIFDEHGNPVWSARFPGTRTITLEDASSIEVLQELGIVGGTGRFAGASGSFILSGYTELNTLRPGRGELQLKGVIVY